MGLFDKKPTQPPPNTNGPAHAVPCPHCGHPNDFRELESHQVDVGDLAACDKCDGVMKVTAKQNVVVVHVARINQKSPREKGPGGAQTISQAQANRLLGRR